MKRRALTLVEMLLSMGLSLTLLVAMLATFQAGQRLFLSALDAVALSDFQYRVPREIVQKITACRAAEIQAGDGAFALATAFDQNHQFQLNPEGFPIWQGTTTYALSQGRLLQKEPWEKAPRTLLGQITYASLRASNGAYLLILQTDYRGYTRNYRGEVSMWATPVN